jgi:hypothetical protein
MYGLTSFGPRSLSGHLLEGTKIVRLIYVDEAGLSNPQQEPFLVVGAVAVHADNQLVATERHLQRLVEKWIPEEQRQGFVFHAKELFNGGGRVFKRNDEQWPLNKRLEVADDLAAIPRRQGLRLCFAAVDKRVPPSSVGEQWEKSSPREKVLFWHASAFLSCAVGVDKWMRAEHPEEVCMLIAEDNDQARTLLRDVTNYHKRDDAGANFSPQYRPFFPLRKIKEDPFFQPKRSKSVLQLADFWSYVAKKKVMGDARYDRFANPMWPSLMPPIFDVSGGRAA